MDRAAYYTSYEERLQKSLVEKCQSMGYLSDHLLEVEELDETWHKIAPEYMSDAVPNIINFPMAAVAWSGYLGMAMALLWDTDWERATSSESLYRDTVGVKGFDLFDEYVMGEMYGLQPQSQEWARLEELMRICAESALSMIRHEHIEPQSVDAFHIFAHTTKIFYRVGVSVGLKMLGYKYEKVMAEIPREKIN